MNKKNILKLLHFIRKILTVLRNNCFPSPIPRPITILTRSSDPFYSPHELFEKEQLEKCYNHFKSYFQNAIFLSNEENDYHKYVIERAKQNDTVNKKTYLEFGVYVGTSINFFSKYVDKIYGFDSFEGLREDWAGNHSSNTKGTFNLNKKLPKLNKNVVPIIGWVQDTLDSFLEEHKPEINFAHMDLDTYESTKFVLTRIKPYLLKNSIVSFDQLYNFPGWEQGEYKALKETFNENEYKFISFGKTGKQATIQII